MTKILKDNGIKSPLHGALENRILAPFGVFGTSWSFFFARFYPLTFCDKSLVTVTDPNKHM